MEIDENLADVAQLRQILIGLVEDIPRGTFDIELMNKSSNQLLEKMNEITMLYPIQLEKLNS